MLAGILQKLTIIDTTDERLLLREYPLLDWVVVAALFILAANMAILNIWITAVAGVTLGMFFWLRARTRYILFDVAEDLLLVEHHSILQQETVLRVPLEHISRAYLHKADDGSTQIILVNDVGEEMGLSVYSRDMQPWKEEIVIAVNAILHTAHKRREDEGGI